MGVQLFFWQYDNPSTLMLASTTSIQPKLMMHLPYGEHDDFRQGRSCFYQGMGTSGRHRWHPSNIRMSLLGNKNYIDDNSPWSCQECTNGKCRPLQRLGRCSPPPSIHQEAPRVMSQKSPFTNQKSHTLVFNHDPHPDNFLSSTALSRQQAHSPNNDEMPVCSGTLSLPCFDLSRCSRFGPIKVYPYGNDIINLLDSAIRQTHGLDLIQKTDNPQNACLLVAASGRETPALNTELMGHKLKFWAGGQNHYIYHTATTGVEVERPRHFGMAATSQIPSTMDGGDTYIREGYDMPLGLVYPPLKWQKPLDLNIHRKRRLLLSFWGPIDSQYSWIASEYWVQQPNQERDSIDNNNVDYDRDVHVQTDCGTNSFNMLDVDTVQQEVLLNSTFHFCPGGSTSSGGAASSSSSLFRFAEALFSDAIPVVTSDFVAPFHPDIDWSNCLVRVSEARVVDIPSILRSIPEDEVYARQEECKMLNEKVFGLTGDANQQQFTVAMQIWAIRIKNALRSKFEIADTVLA